MLKINPRLEIQVSRINDQHHCVVIDDFLLNPEVAVDYACRHHGGFIPQERAYPGKVLPVTNDFMSEVNRFVQRKMSRLFPICRGGIEFHSQFSLATLQPEEFTWIQRLCHTDPRLASDRVNYAALLYLFENPALGGTGFYRLKDPEFWQQMSSKLRDDPEAEIEILRNKFQMFREPARYMTESCEIADLLDRVPAKFNRFVFYSGDLPHSAFIEQPELLNEDPAKGRLTLNCFVNAVPKNRVLA
jgi:hypothetical protein